MKHFFWMIFCCLFWDFQLNAQEKHTVQEGESLSLIAEKYYKRTGYWFVLFNSNKGKELEIAINPKTRMQYFVPNELRHPNLIYPGQILFIPFVDDHSLIDEHYLNHLLTNEDLLIKSIGFLKVIKGDSTLNEGKYYKIEKGGRIYSYNESLSLKEDWIEVGKWLIKEKNLYLFIAGKEIIFQFSNGNLINPIRFKCYQLDENGKKSEELEMIKAYPPPKTFKVSGKLFFNGKPLEGVVVSGGGKIDTSDASGFYILRLKNGDEISFEKKNYKTKSVYTKDWQIQDIISLEREEPPIPSRVFSGKVLNEQGKAFKGVKVFLELNQQQFGPYQVQKDGTWQSETIPFTWEQIESQATYLILYKKQEKVIEIPENLNEKVDLGKVIIEKK